VIPTADMPSDVKLLNLKADSLRDPCYKEIDCNRHSFSTGAMRAVADYADCVSAALKERVLPFERVPNVREIRACNVFERFVPRLRGGRDSDRRKVEGLCH
jgi:hypothetical protein